MNVRINMKMKMTMKMKVRMKMKPFYYPHTCKRLSLSCMLDFLFTIPLDCISNIATPSWQGRVTMFSFTSQDQRQQKVVCVPGYSGDGDWLGALVGGRHGHRSAQREISIILFLFVYVFIEFCTHPDPWPVKSKVAMSVSACVCLFVPLHARCRHKTL